YAMGAVPSYRVVGRVAGLNLRQLPGGETLPATDLNADIDIRGQGTTLETLAGDFRIDATRSTVGGRPLEALLARINVSGGVATVDTLAVALADTRLSAEGTWGLTRPSAEPLNFRLVSSDLGSLAPFLPTVGGVPPRMTGEFTLEGSVAGSVRVPVVDVVFSGEDLRYEGWRARRLEFGLAATLSRRVEEITGELTLRGEELDLAGRAALASLTVGLEGGGPQIVVRVAAERDARTGLALSGLLQMQGSTPVGVLLDSLTVRAADEVAWQLTTPSRLRWGGTDGVLVSNLNLRRTGGEPGLISLNGTIPPTGIADLRVEVDNFDLALVRQLVPTYPVLAGMVDLNAVLQGSVTDPQLTIDGSVVGFQYRDVALDSIALTGRYAERVFDANATVRVAGSELATATAAVPMRLAFENGRPTFALLRENPLRAEVVADSLPVALLASSVPTIENPTGSVSAEFSATGTIDQPRLAGWAELSNGAATFTDLGVRYDAMRGRATFDGEVVRIDSLVIRSGGTARARGAIRLVNLQTPELQIEARMDGFRAIENDEVADLTVTGSVSLTGRMPRPVLTGQVAVDESVIYFPNFGQEVPLALTELEIGEVTPDTALANAVGPGFVQNVQIVDLNVTLGDQVWMEAPTARVQIRGGLVVYRAGQDMRLYGNLEAVRGTYALTIGPIVREFDVTGGSVRFLGTPDLNPELDITAEHEIRTAPGAGPAGTLSIVVRVTGTAEFPRVALTSDTQPPLPESELLNYLVFGQPSFRLSQQQGFAQQLVVQEVLGGLLAQELGQLGLPCQYLRLRGRPTEIALGSPLAGLGATSLECGVQLLGDVFLTLETGVASAVNSSPFSALLGVSLDWQIKEYLAARIAREPVRSGAGALFQSADVPYQWSGDLTGRWEFARPDTTSAMRPQVPGPGAPGAPAPPVPAPPAPPPPGPVPANTPAPAGGTPPARTEGDSAPE
ncbi:MAG: translocation/assembly module TamB domain-containing protein, partial [Gemmatimonadetes bacterium]|nr:translocation/assembly module TamB domain-containing protein [Gemmatimonadota bacterium]